MSCRRSSSWWAFGLVALLCVGLLGCTRVVAEAGDPGADMPGVMKLTSANFWDVVGKDKAAFVEFYAPWCGHCKNMADEYAKLGAALLASPKSQEQLVVAKLDGSNDRTITGELGVRGFPTMMYFPAGSKKPEQYAQGRTAESIIDFLKEKNAALDLFVPKPRQYVEEIDATTFNDRVMEDRKVNVLVLFYAPWCGHCKQIKPVLNEVARIFENEHRVHVVQVNGDDPKNKELAESLHVEGYPTILFYEFGSRALPPTEYKGGRTVEDFVAFLNSHTHTERKLDGDVNENFGLVDMLTKPLHAMVESVGDAAALEANYEDFLQHGRGLRGENVEYYTKLARRVKEDKSTAFLDSELARLTKILSKDGSGAVSGVRRDGMMRRRNIIEAVKENRKTELRDATGAIKRSSEAAEK